MEAGLKTTSAIRGDCVTLRSSPVKAITGTGLSRRANSLTTLLPLTMGQSKLEITRLKSFVSSKSQASLQLEAQVTLNPIALKKSSNVTFRKTEESTYSKFWAIENSFT